MDALNRVVIGGPVDSLALKAAMAASTGVLAGSFNHPASNRSVAFGGVVYQKTHTAGGYFLYFPLRPAGQPAPSGAGGGVGVGP